MTKNEEVDLLRRDLADLRDRVARLEAERAPFIAPLKPPTAAPQIPMYPSTPMPLPNALPWQNTCACPPNSLCMNAACPRRSVITCAAPTYGPDH